MPTNTEKPPRKGGGHAIESELQARVITDSLSSYAYSPA